MVPIEKPPHVFLEEIAFVYVLREIRVIHLGVSVDDDRRVRSVRIFSVGPGFRLCGGCPAQAHAVTERRLAFPIVIGPVAATGLRQGKIAGQVAQGPGKSRYCISQITFVGELRSLVVKVIRAPGGTVISWSP